MYRDKKSLSAIPYQFWSDIAATYQFPPTQEEIHNANQFFDAIKDYALPVLCKDGNLKVSSETIMAYFNANVTLAQLLRVCAFTCNSANFRIAHGLYFAIWRGSDMIKNWFLPVVVETQRFALHTIAICGISKRSQPERTAFVEDVMSHFVLGQNDSFTIFKRQ